jgi:CheY-like chemotaxis protein
MPAPVLVVAQDADARSRLSELVQSDPFVVDSCAPDALPEALPALFIVALPALESPEEQLIERLRADDATASIPIVIASKLPMVQLQSVPYASDWTIAIVEEPVKPDVLADTMGFLLNPDST